MKTVLLACDIYENGKDPHRQEWESEESLLILSKTIEELGYIVVILSQPITIVDFICKFIINNSKSDLVVFNLVEGFSSRNREGYIPGICEYLGVCHTGSDAYAQNVSLDKHLTKLILSEIKVLTPKYRKMDEFIPGDQPISYPMFLKPNYEGSSLGIDEKSIVQNADEFKKTFEILNKDFDDILTEKYISGEDITIGILGNKGNYTISEPARIVYEDVVYSQTIKSKLSMAESLIFDLHHKMCEKIKLVSLQIVETLKISGYARIDYIVSGEELYFLEINLTPGLSCIYSVLPKLWKHSDLSYERFINQILDLALSDYSGSKRFNYGKGEEIIVRLDI